MRSGARGRGVLLVPILLFPFFILNAVPALAADFSENNGTVIFIAGLVVVTIFSWSFYVVRRLSREVGAARRRTAILEVCLNEAETALAAEAHLLILWRGRKHDTARIIGDLYGTAQIPKEEERLLDFSLWLEADSAAALIRSVAKLKEDGTAFNIAVKTLNNEWLEADGRVAGAAASLRLRPLVGERQQITELAYEANKLRQQIERLSAILDGAPLPIWLRDMQGALIWVNQTYIKTVGAHDSDQVLSSDMILVEPGHIETKCADTTRSYLGRASQAIAGMNRIFDLFEADIIIGRAGFAVDVSDLDVVQKELARHISAHASILNKLSTAIVIFGPDQKLHFYNEAYAELWQLDKNFLNALPSDGEILDHLRVRRCIPEQANYPEWRARHLSSYATVGTRESWWYLPDGRSLRVICERHPFGGVTYLYENATKEIQLESRYNELIGVQRETLDNLEEGVTLFGSDGRLKLFNPAFSRFWDFDVAYLEAEPHVDVIAERAGSYSSTEGAWDEIRFSMTSLHDGRRPINGKMLAGDRTLQYATVPLPDGNTLLTFVDVSSASRMERALRERADALEAADRLKNSFLTNVSYQVRTPLTSIMGFAESLTYGLSGPLSDKQQEYVTNIEKSASDLKVIIDAIIDLSAIDAGAMELQLERVDIFDLLQTAANQATELFEAHDINLHIEISADIGSFVADSYRVAQVLQNLLSNAIGFSEPGSTIKMGARRQGRLVQFWVSDTGRGIEPDFQKQAFDRFQAKSVRGGHHGPGLGLAVVKSFVELHEGNVSLISKLDKGTTVVCNFPVDGPPNHDQSPPPRQPTSSRQAA